ncbi:hypothetical protein TELCIR_07494 [Teladorsagia circumcincta]|uniref:Rhodanese domain-containing protein n=1 Tax=Teladorsagia circumcincta TaxID=45464 RepID=A0A2G9UK68_TELCI|nr:hypothetical protein TELCIR_07494 [Teladorsagia circumcincta]
MMKGDFSVSVVLNVVSPAWLAKHTNSVVILDVTYDMGPKPDPEEFKNKHYAQFGELMKEKPKSYLAEHIPGAVLFNIDAAYYPSKYIRFDLYPPQDFEKFIRLLGVNNNDHVINYLDARPAGQYNGSEPLGATGAHLKGAKSVPLALVVSENGLIPRKEIIRVLHDAGFIKALPTVTACSGGVQASMLALVLSHVGVKSRVYNGSMSEIGLRAPQLISEK